MKLYGFPGSPNTWKVRAFAAHIGVPLDFMHVDLTKGEQKRPEYLAISPRGRTPALVDGDFTLWESTAILQYIGDKKPGELWPKDARTRADIVRWQSWQLQHWAEGCVPMLFERVVKAFFNLGPPDPAALKKAEETFHAEAQMLDAHLARHSHLVNDRLTLADFSVASYLVYAERAEMPLAPYRNIQRWLQAVIRLPAWATTAPQT
jgi:glutathione S-transferase